MFVFVPLRRHKGQERRVREGEGRFTLGPAVRAMNG
jgi:hypothetical protein